MEEKQRKMLFESHKILLEEKNQRINEAKQIVQVRLTEFQDAVIVVTKELGIEKEDITKWTISEDGQAIEKIKDGDK